MRTHLRFAALALAGAMCVAGSANSARAAEDLVDKSTGLCKIGCTTAALGCGSLGGDAEFCAGMLAGCLYGCSLQ